MASHRPCGYTVSRAVAYKPDDVFPHGSCWWPSSQMRCKIAKGPGGAKWIAKIIRPGSAYPLPVLWLLFSPETSKRIKQGEPAVAVAGAVRSNVILLFRLPAASIAT